MNSETLLSLFSNDESKIGRCDYLEPQCNAFILFYNFRGRQFVSYSYLISIYVSRNNLELFLERFNSGTYKQFRNYLCSQKQFRNSCNDNYCAVSTSLTLKFYNFATLT